MANVLLITEPPVQALPLRLALLGSGYSVLDELDCAPEPNATAKLVKRVREIGAAVLIIATKSPSAALMAALQAIDREEPHPVLLFTNDTNTDKIETATQAGVASYVIDGFSAKRLRTLVDVALAKFRATQALRQRAVNAEQKLAERKLIDRAKGILMKTRNMSEEEAYHALRKLAMERQQSLGTTADQVIAMAKLLAA